MDTTLLMMVPLVFPLIWTRVPEIDIVFVTNVFEPIDAGLV